MSPLTISSYTLTNALGRGNNASHSALFEGRSGLRPCDLEDVGLKTWIGRVDGLEAIALPENLSAYDCRNNRLAYLALQQDGFSESVDKAISQYSAERIGIFIGTSTSGIATTEQAYLHKNPTTGQLRADYEPEKTHNVFSSTSFPRAFLGLRGPALAISTACSSSAKVFAAAHRYIESGLCDAAVVGGVDSLCMTTLYGFNSLDLISEAPCRPWDIERQGINIGEAAGFALLEKTDAASTGPRLLGYGESSDAYHMSTPHPQGAGAVLAMQQALDRAGVTPDDIDYINLHGTATRANDLAEDKAVVQCFGNRVSCSSTKGFLGHTLGAAGITEAIISLLCLNSELIPKNLQTENPDPELHANVTLTTERRKLNYALTNSFGFGGNNCSLLFGRPV
ncbi:MAG: beta-ketoacyl-[acyl-carrier-protein] synthase family protein [Candidatus Thiodiazotropha sp. (ex Myrtea sp. 'scaly one' KF741663)]|nr:beta-ketoacyl-[acyl-carrier-protein] synthase family protein [Candidatus Thiodiazotropha sp. (ex Myrtea sp. 'scaly one' KF741663)]